jgi:hypothetical protein
MDEFIIPPASDSRNKSSHPDTMMGNVGLAAVQFSHDFRIAMEAGDS